MFRILTGTGIQLNPDPNTAKNLNPDPDPEDPETTFFVDTILNNTVKINKIIL